MTQSAIHTFPALVRTRWDSDPPDEVDAIKRNGVHTIGLITELRSRLYGDLLRSMSRYQAEGGEPPTALQFNAWLSTASKLRALESK